MSLDDFNLAAPPKRKHVSKQKGAQQLPADFFFWSPLPDRIKVGATIHLWGIASLQEIGLSSQAWTDHLADLLAEGQSEVVIVKCIASFKLSDAPRIASAKILKSLSPSSPFSATAEAIELARQLDRPLVRSLRVTAASAAEIFLHGKTFFPLPIANVKQIGPNMLKQSWVIFYQVCTYRIGQVGPELHKYRNLEFVSLNTISL